MEEDSYGEDSYGDYTLQDEDVQQNVVSENNDFYDSTRDEEISSSKAQRKNVSKKITNKVTNKPKGVSRNSPKIIAEEPPKKVKVPGKRIQVKTHKKNVREETRSPKTSNRKRSFDEEFTIKFKPRTIIKVLVILLLFVMFFFLGRFTAPGDAVNVESDVPIVEPEVVEDKGEISFIDLIGSMFSLFSGDGEGTETLVASATPSGDTSSSSTASISSDASSEATTSSATSAETTTESTTAKTTVTEPEADEPLITSYKKVSIALSSEVAEWKGTWGKITSIEYTIKNQEQGTVKPSYFLMMMKGYDDFEKKIPVPPASKTMKAGVTHKAKIPVPSGFAYNPSSVGNLDKVEITLELYDASDKQMATIKKTTSLPSS